MHISTQIKPFTYLGSKFSILPWLLPKLPKCHHYVSVCGGSGVDLLNREPSPIETFNDVNGEVVNFFRMLRDRPEGLMRALEFTPHSRSEYENAWFNPDDTDIEKARKFFVRTQQSFMATGAQNQLKGWLSSTNESRRGISQATHKFLSGVAGLREVFLRLKNVQVENRSFEWIMGAYDSPGTLFYCDPPYDDEKRSGKNDYTHEFTLDHHRQLRDIAAKVLGKVAISGYDTELMRELYKDFYFVEGPRPKNTYRKSDEVRECLWTNYDVRKMGEGTLFAGM